MRAVSRRARAECEVASEVASEDGARHAQADACKRARLRMNWARLRKRVFDIDVEHCACGGKLKFVAVIEQPEGIEKFLDPVREKTAR